LGITETVRLQNDWRQFCIRVAFAAYRTAVTLALFRQYVVNSMI